MEQRKAIGKNLRDSIDLVRELLDVIQVNLEILDVLKLKGKISLIDKQFIEITNLDRKHRRSCEDFMLNTLPDYLNSETVATDKVLFKKYELWSSDLIFSLTHLDKICKEFIQDQINQDKKLKKIVKDMQVKDKRFWRFLDIVKGKGRIFDSFNEESEDANIID